MIFSFKIRDIVPYINWIYFFHAWGFNSKFATVSSAQCCPACRRSWISSFGILEQTRAIEAAKLFDDAQIVLRRLDCLTNAKALFGLYEVNADGNNIVFKNGTVFPLLRQQSHFSSDSPFLCLADFIRPATSGLCDQLGVFSACIDDEDILVQQDDPYEILLIQTLCDRLVEAAVELLHLRIRTEIWGYAKDENLSIADLLIEKFQGIRPAVGYPSLPDQSVNFLIDKLLNFNNIGITLTENGAMHPHASVSGLMFAHPQARYFSVGKIGEDQLAAYSCQRGFSIELMRKFLAANL